MKKYKKRPRSRNPFSKIEMKEMKEKWERLSKLAITWLKEIHGEYWNSYFRKNK